MKITNQWRWLLLGFFLFQACGSGEDSARQWPFADLGHSLISDPGPGAINGNTQAVYLSFLPQYREALDLFGLKPADAQIRKAIRYHLRKALSDYNVAVLIQESERALAGNDQTLTIEITGPDPNNMDLLSLDNYSLRKDTANKVRSEVIGGFSAIMRDAGEPAYGGIFLDSFMKNFGEDGSTIYSPRFVEVFETLAPSLDGSPLTKFPGNSDDDTIYQVVSVFGALLADTVVHLVGDAVGAPPGNEFHHQDHRGCYMDIASNRSFEERALLDGKSDSFCSDCSSYLKQILGK